MNEYKLDGFTLFKGNKGWQLSRRIEGEGWLVQIVDEYTALAILDNVKQMLQEIPEEPVIKPLAKRPRARLDDGDLL